MFISLEQIAKQAARLPDNYADAVTIHSSTPPVTATVASPKLGKELQVMIDNAKQDGKPGIEGTCSCGAEKPCYHIAAVYRYVSEVPIEQKTDAEVPIEEETDAKVESKSDPIDIAPDNHSEATKTATAVATRTSAPPVPRLVATPGEMVERHKELTELIKTALEEGRDYGKIPGTNKATLLKPGAERIAVAFGCYPRYTIVESEVDHDRQVEYEDMEWRDTKDKPTKEVANRLKAQGKGRWRKKNGDWVWQVPGEQVTRVVQGLYRYVIECQLVSRQTGAVMGSGIASCSSMEPKYISRPRALENTVLKMSEKRALVAAVLNTFGLSDRFTQDLEDYQ